MHYRHPRKSREKRPEKLFDKIMGENIPYWGRKQTPRSRKAREFQKDDPKRNTLRHFNIKIIKIKDKEKILRATREKQHIREAP